MIHNYCFILLLFYHQPDKYEQFCYILNKPGPSLNISLDGAMSLFPFTFVQTPFVPRQICFQGTLDPGAVLFPMPFNGRVGMRKMST